MLNALTVIAYPDPESVKNTVQSLEIPLMGVIMTLKPMMRMTVKMNMEAQLVMMTMKMMTTTVKTMMMAAQITRAVQMKMTVY